MGIIISAGSPELVALASAHFKIMSPVILIGGSNRDLLWASGYSQAVYSA